jgi:hypothetical protein
MCLACMLRPATSPQVLDSYLRGRVRQSALSLASFICGRAACPCAQGYNSPTQVYCNIFAVLGYIRTQRRSSNVFLGPLTCTCHVQKRNRAPAFGQRSRNGVKHSRHIKSLRDGGTSQVEFRPQGTHTPEIQVQRFAYMKILHVYLRRTAW